MLHSSKLLDFGIGNNRTNTGNIQSIICVPFGTRPIDRLILIPPIYCNILF